MCPKRISKFKAKDLAMNSITLKKFLDEFIVTLIWGIYSY